MTAHRLPSPRLSLWHGRRRTSASQSPVSAHIAALRARLPGPVGKRSELLGELSDGLLDQAEAFRRAGLTGVEAEARAVAEAGTVDELVPAYRAELTVSHGLRAATLIAVSCPALVVAWDTSWLAGAGWRHGTPAMHALSAVVDITSYATGGVALLVLAALIWVSRRGGDVRGWLRLLTVGSSLGIVTIVSGSLLMSLVMRGAVAHRPFEYVLMYLTCTVSFGVLIAQLRMLWRTHHGLRAW